MKKIISILLILISSTCFSMPSLDYVVIDNTNTDLDLTLSMGWGSKMLLQKNKSGELPRNWIVNGCNYDSICKLSLKYYKNNTEHSIAFIYINTKKSPMEIVDYDNEIDDDYHVYYGPSWNTFYLARKYK